jgi:hypothetical protein
MQVCVRMLQKRLRFCGWDVRNRSIRMIDRPLTDPVFCVSGVLAG